MFPKERIFASLLNYKRISWIYHPNRFILSSGKSYEPDFYLPEEKKYIEVVGTRQAYYAIKNKIKLFREEYPGLKIDILFYLGFPYPGRISSCEVKEKKLKNKRSKKFTKIAYCPKCNSGETYYRKIMRNFACKTCGSVFEEGKERGW